MVAVRQKDYIRATFRDDPSLVRLVDNAEARCLTAEWLAARDAQAQERTG
jgi:hypothetical protein